MPIPSPAEQLRFLKDVQALLEDGQFVSTYKFALLIALADVAVESGVDDDRSLEVPIAAIAEKYLEYYWQHSAPYPGRGHRQPLASATGKQARVVSVLHERRLEGFDSLARLRADHAAWRETLRTIEATIKVMPLFKLQQIGGVERTFLYPNEVRDGAVRLEPGVAYHLRNFHPLVTGLARERWLAMIRRLPANLYAVGQSQDLEAFLFGSGREPVAQHFEPLLAAQRGRCLYCGQSIRSGSGHVDHFIPWMLHRCNELPNLVAAHDHCNQSKKAWLACESHLERWVSRNAETASVLGKAPASEPTLRDVAPLDRVAHVALWAYDRAFDLQTLVWESGRQLQPLTGRYRTLLASGDGDGRWAR